MTDEKRDLKKEYENKDLDKKFNFFQFWQTTIPNPHDPEDNSHNNNFIKTRYVEPNNADKKIK